MTNLRNIRVYIRTDLIDEIRKQYTQETRHMTNDTMIDWIISDKILLTQ
jgi:hypothetical protein